MSGYARRREALNRGEIDDDILWEMAKHEVARDHGIEGYEMADFYDWLEVLNDNDQASIAYAGICECVMDDFGV
jgi:hypothetical protein